jgi:hypothetical protein
MTDLGIILIVIGVILIPTAYIIYRQVILIQKANRQAFQKRFERIQLLANKIKNGQPVNEPDIYEFAKNTLTRELTFRLLQHSDLAHLFPNEFYTIEKAAESNLVNWLEFPTELGACPDEIDYVKKVSFNFDGKSNIFDYYVYKFRMYDPHWAAKDGWMIGVVGPYFQNSKPYDHPNSTFSRLTHELSAGSADEEAKWVHENVFLPFVSIT